MPCLGPLITPRVLDVNNIVIVEVVVTDVGKESLPATSQGKGFFGG